MKKLLAMLIFYFVQFILWLRYRVTIKGLDQLNKKTLPKDGGILFLPNHPTVFVDPSLITLAIWKKYPLRPMIVEYMYYMPVVHWLMNFMNAIPVPNFVATSNSLKKKRAEQAFEKMTEGLKNGDNFLIYPAGKVKHQAREVVGGSGVHNALQAVPETNVVLVRITGLWGSSFSRALTGTTPYMFPTIFKGVRKALKNLIFFTPRREVTIEFVPAPADFPFDGSRVDLNHYLEKWYNRPDGIIKTSDPEPGESLYLVSYNMWKEDLPHIKTTKQDASFDLAKIPAEIQQKVSYKLSEMAQIPIGQINPDMELGTDLGLDSLDTAELLAFLDDQYEVSGVPVGELTTVGKLMGVAAKQVTFGEQAEEEQKDLSKWNQPVSVKRRLRMPEGSTIPEVFLNTCAQLGKDNACGDMRMGILSYQTAKLRIILLAEYIRQLPGENIGILLPSSVAAYLTIIACQMAGKVPVMINWTVGPRHLETVKSVSNIQVVLSSWAFLERLENANLTGIEDLIVTLEDARRGFKLKDKLKGLYLSKLNTQSILNHFGKLQSNAVILFTSGTESMPKGVPLTHENILSNQRASLEVFDLYNDDSLLGILPPFHSFGFTVTGLLPLLAGCKVSFYPDPTNGPGLAKSVEKWSSTIICGAPTFLKGMFKNASPEQLKTLRLVVTGAEKAPMDLFEMVEDLEHARLIEGYGITECSPILTANMEGNPNLGVGHPVPGVELKIVDIEKHQPLADGNQGLVIVKGPNIFSGYLNKGVSSPFVTVNGEQWYSTGDLGYLDSDNNLIISGRLKRFVKIGGEMVSLTAIEDALLHTIGKKVKNLQEDGPILAVSAKEIPGEKTKIFLFTRFSSSIEEANQALREGGFSNLIRITKVIQIDTIPIMGTGKVNYRALEGQIPANENNHMQMANIKL